MGIMNWLRGEEVKDPVIKDLEAELYEAENMILWHTKKLEEHKLRAQRYRELIEKVKNQ